MGIAVGCIGMPFNDFCRLTPEEFSYIYKAYSEREESQYRDRWERLRMLGTMVLQPYTKKSLKPKDVLTLPWDNDMSNKPKTPVLSKEEALKRFKELVKRAK